MQNCILAQICLACFNVNGQIVCLGTTTYNSVDVNYVYMWMYVHWTQIQGNRVDRWTAGTTWLLYVLYSYTFYYPALLL